MLILRWLLIEPTIRLGLRYVSYYLLANIEFEPMLGLKLTGGRLGKGERTMQKV